MQRLRLETIDILDPDLYVQRGYPHAEWALLRREAPVFWYERPKANPFWAVTKDADIVAVSREPGLFRSGQLLFVEIEEPDAPARDEAILDEPLPQFELLSYFARLIIAGNETTRNATTGGFDAFLKHPDQWQRLKCDRSLVPSAAEEILRWTSPVIQFARTATAEAELYGARVRAGDTLALFYPSANRDEEVFEQPFAFDIGRTPNSHLAFGIGEHYCLGANLARLERNFIRRQLQRVGRFRNQGRPICSRGAETSRRSKGLRSA